MSSIETAFSNSSEKHKQSNKHTHYKATPHFAHWITPLRDSLQPMCIQIHAIKKTAMRTNIYFMFTCLWCDVNPNRGSLHRPSVERAVCKGAVVKLGGAYLSYGPNIYRHIMITMKLSGFLHVFHSILKNFVSATARAAKRGKETTNDRSNKSNALHTFKWQPHSHPTHIQARHPVRRRSVETCWVVKSVRCWHPNE